ncbi:hypothetical protein B0H17DRAFT_1331835, partial [Mycena rosella]
MKRPYTPHPGVVLLALIQTALATLCVLRAVLRDVWIFPFRVRLFPPPFPLSASDALMPRRRPALTPTPGALLAPLVLPFTLVFIIPPLARRVPILSLFRPGHADAGFTHLLFKGTSCGGRRRACGGGPLLRCVFVFLWHFLLRFASSYSPHFCTLRPPFPGLLSSCPPSLHPLLFSLFLILPPSYAPYPPLVRLSCFPLYSSLSSISPRRLCTTPRPASFNALLRTCPLQLLTFRPSAFLLRRISRRLCARRVALVLCIPRLSFHFLGACPSFRSCLDFPLSPPVFATSSVPYFVSSLIIILFFFIQSYSVSSCSP